MKVYGLPEGQGLDRRVDMAQVAVEALAQGQSINVHSARSQGYYCF